MSVRRARAAAAVPTYVSDVDSGMIPSADSSMHKLSGDEADRERAAGRSRLGASSPATTAVPNTPVPMLKDHLSEPQSMVDEPEEMSDYFGAGPSQSSPENVAPQPISPPVDAEVTPVTEPPVTKPEVSNVEPAPSMPMPKPEEPRVPELIPTVTPVVVEPATPPPEAERAAPPRPPVLQTAALNPLSDPRLRDAPPLLSAVDEGDEPASAKFSVPPTTIHEEPVFRNEVSPLSAPPSMPEPEPSAPQTPPPTMAYAEPIQSESESQSRLALSSRLPIPLELDSQPAPRVQPDVRDFVSSIPPPEPQAAPQAVATPYFPEESRYVSPPLPQTQQLNMPEPRPDIKSRVPDSPPAYLQSDTVYTPPLPLEDPPYLSLDPRKAKAFGFPEPAAYRPDPVVVSNGYTNGHSKTDEDDQKAQNGGIRRNENGFEVLPSPADSLASRYLPGSLDPSTLSYAPPDPTTAIPFSLFFNVVFNNPFQSLLRPFTHISPYSSPRQRPASPEERPQEMSLDRSQDNAQDVANNYANAMASDPGTVDRFVSVLKCHSYIPLLGSPYLSLTLPIPRIVSEIFTWAWDFFWSDDDDDQFDGAQDANREAARGQNYNREAAEPVPQDG